MFVGVGLLRFRLGIQDWKSRRLNQFTLELYRSRTFRFRDSEAGVLAWVLSSSSNILFRP